MSDDPETRDKAFYSRDVLVPKAVKEDIIPLRVAVKMPEVEALAEESYVRVNVRVEGTGAVAAEVRNA